MAATTRLRVTMTRQSSKLEPGRRHEILQVIDARRRPRRRQLAGIVDAAAGLCLASRTAACRPAAAAGIAPRSDRPAASVPWSGRAASGCPPYAAGTSSSTCRRSARWRGHRSTRARRSRAAHAARRGEGDLLERAAAISSARRPRPAAAPSKPGMSMPLGQLRVERAARQRAHDDVGAARRAAPRQTRTCQLPLSSLEEERNARRRSRELSRKLSSTTSGASSPAWKDEPVSRLETITSAGLNNMRIDFVEVAAGGGEDFGERQAVVAELWNSAAAAPASAPPRRRRARRAARGRRR